MKIFEYVGRNRMFRKLFGLDKQIRVQGTHSGATPMMDLMFGPAGSWYNQAMQFNQDRRNVIRDIEEMESYSLIASALDIYAEEATQYDLEHDATVWVESKNDDLQEMLTTFLDEVMHIEETIYGRARTLAKYGDLFEMVCVGKKKNDDPESDDSEGIIALRYVRPDMITRLEDIFGRFLGFVPGILDAPVDPMDLPEERFDPWDFVHSRIAGGRMDSLGGDSLLLPARRLWRQLKIMEDSMVLYRLNRAPDKLVWYIDTGSQPIDAQMRTLQWWRQFTKKHKYLDPAGGQLRQEYNPLTVDEDIWMAVSTNNQSKVEKLPGSTNIGEITDVEMFRDMLFATLKIPKAYMGFEGDINAKATLLAQDVRFARTIKKLQRALIQGIIRACQIHMVLKGLDPTDENNQFNIKMAPVSFLDDLQRKELYEIRLDLAARLSVLGEELNLERIAWATFILTEFLGMSEKTAQKLLSGGAAAGGVQGEVPPTPEEAQKVAQVFAASGLMKKVKDLASVSGHHDVKLKPRNLPDSTKVTALASMTEKDRESAIWKSIQEHKPSDEDDKEQAA